MKCTMKRVSASICLFIALGIVAIPAEKVTARYGLAQPLALQIACNKAAAQKCQRKAHDCMDGICPHSHDPAQCRQGCLNRYSGCKEEAGC
jgi:hypothetical protein